MCRLLQELAHRIRTEGTSERCPIPPASEPYRARKVARREVPTNMSLLPHDLEASDALSAASRVRTLEPKELSVCACVFPLWWPACPCDTLETRLCLVLRA